MMRMNKNAVYERVLLSDEQLDEVVGGAESAHRPGWLRRG